MAYTYSHLYGFATTSLRFFTVYGPWGRPDMAMFLFTNAILQDRPIKVFNNGQMERDFTYKDDITQGVVRILKKDAKERADKKENYKVYNIGNTNSVKLLDFIEAKRELLPMQSGDVEKTWANVDDLIQDYDYSPNTPVEEGIVRFIEWFKAYYGVGGEN